MISLFFKVVSKICWHGGKYQMKYYVENKIFYFKEFLFEQLWCYLALLADALLTIFYVKLKYSLLLKYFVIVCMK